MKLEISREVTRAMKSVVVVFDRKVTQEFCAGFVAVARAGTSLPATFVIAPSGFVAGRKHVGVCFFDGVQSRAQPVRAPVRVSGDTRDFCLLRTKHHPHCEEVSWMDSSSALLTPSPTFVLPPMSRTVTYHLPTFTVVESTESYHVENHIGLADDSKNYFLVSCNYQGKAYNEAEVPAFTMPVFTIGSGSTKSIAMGVLLNDCYPGTNSEMKVAVTATHFQEILESFVGSASRRSPPRRKRKRMEQNREEVEQNRGEVEEGPSTPSSPEEDPSSSSPEEDPSSSSSESSQEDPSTSES